MAWHPRNEHAPLYYPRRHPTTESPVSNIGSPGSTLSLARADANQPALTPVSGSLEAGEHCLEAIGTLPPYFQSRISVDQESGCWLWTGNIHPHGYGFACGGGHKGQAHRLTYTMLRGHIPGGFVPDHLCRNRACVNPWHMDLVNRAQNCRRGVNSKPVSYTQPTLQTKA